MFIVKVVLLLLKMMLPLASQPNAQQSVGLQAFDSLRAFNCRTPSGSCTTVGSEKHPSGVPQPSPWLLMLEKLVLLSVQD